MLLFLASVRHIESISFSRTPYFVCTVFHQPWTTFWVRRAKHAINLYKIVATKWRPSWRAVASRIFCPRSTASPRSDMEPTSLCPTVCWISIWPKSCWRMRHCWWWKLVLWWPFWWEAIVYPSYEAKPQWKKHVVPSNSTWKSSRIIIREVMRNQFHTHFFWVKHTYPV